MAQPLRRCVGLVLLLAIQAISFAVGAANAEQPAGPAPATRPCHVLFVGPKQLLESDLAPFFEQMVERAHPDLDVRCSVESGDGRRDTRAGGYAGGPQLKAWVSHDTAAMTTDIQAGIRGVENAIKQATPRDPSRTTPQTEERLKALRAALAKQQARLKELDGRAGWDYVLIGAQSPDGFQAELVDLALAKGFKVYILLPFGSEAHGLYYGNAHYMPVKGIMPKQVAAAQAAKAPVVSSALSFGTLFQTTGEHKGPFQFYVAGKFTWMGSYLLACQTYATLFNESPVGAWAPETLPETSTKPHPQYELPLKPEYITRFQEQAWKTHQAFAAALAEARAAK
jgi:hypothetical protein